MEAGEISLGVVNAQKRVRDRRFNIWYNLQPEEYRARIEARKKAREKAEQNIKERKKYIYLASFHRWSKRSFEHWLHSAIAQYCEMINEMREEALINKANHKKSEVYMTKMIQELSDVINLSTAHKILLRFNEELNAKQKAEEALVASDESVDSSIAASEQKRPKVDAPKVGVISIRRRRLERMEKKKASEEKRHSRDNEDSGPDSPNPGNPHDTIPKPSTAGTERAKTAESPLVMKLRSGTRCLSLMMPRLILENFGGPRLVCKELRAAEEDEKEHMSHMLHRIVITSDQQFYFKQIALRASYFIKNCRNMVLAVINFSNEVGILDREWAKRTAILLAAAILHKYHKDREQREKGEGYAACRVTAFFRLLRVRRLMGNVWDRVEAEYAAVRVGSSRRSSRVGSPMFDDAPMSACGGRGANTVAASRRASLRASFSRPVTPAGSERKPFRFDQLQCSAQAVSLCFSVSLGVGGLAEMMANQGLGKQGSRVSRSDSSFRASFLMGQIQQKHQDWLKIQCSAYTLREKNKGEVQSSGRKQKQAHRLIIYLYGEKQKMHDDYAQTTNFYATHPDIFRPVNVQIKPIDKSIQGVNSKQKSKVDSELRDQGELSFEDSLWMPQPETDFFENYDSSIDYSLISFQLLVKNLLPMRKYQIEFEFDGFLSKQLSQDNPYFKTLNYPSSPRISRASSGFITEAQDSFVHSGLEWSLDLSSSDSSLNDTGRANKTKNIKVKVFTEADIPAGRPIPLREITAKLLYHSNTTNALLDKKKNGNKENQAGIRSKNPESAVESWPTKVLKLKKTDKDETKNQDKDLPVLEKAENSQSGYVRINWLESREDQAQLTRYQIQRRLCIVAYFPAYEVGQNSETLYEGGWNFVGKNDTLNEAERNKSLFIEGRDNFLDFFQFPQDFDQQPDLFPYLINYLYSRLVDWMTPSQELNSTENGGFISTQVYLQIQYRVRAVNSFGSGPWSPLSRSKLKADSKADNTATVTEKNNATVAVTEILINTLELAAYGRRRMTLGKNQAALSAVIQNQMHRGNLVMTMENIEKDNEEGVSKVEDEEIEDEKIWNNLDFVFPPGAVEKGYEEKEENKNIDMMQGFPPNVDETEDEMEDFLLMLRKACPLT